MIAWAVRSQSFLGLVGLAVFGECGFVWAAIACGVLAIDGVAHDWLAIRQQREVTE